MPARVLGVFVLVIFAQTAFAVAQSASDWTFGSPKAAAAIKKYQSDVQDAQQKLRKELRDVLQKQKANLPIEELKRIETAITKIDAGRYPPPDLQAVRKALNGSNWSWGKGWERNTGLSVSFAMDSYRFSDRPNQPVPYMPIADRMIVTQDGGIFVFNDDVTKFVVIDGFRGEMRTGVIRE